MRTDKGKNMPCEFYEPLLETHNRDNVGRLPNIIYYEQVINNQLPLTHIEKPKNNLPSPEELVKQKDFIQTITISSANCSRYEILFKTAEGDWKYGNTYSHAIRNGMLEAPRGWAIIQSSISFNAHDRYVNSASVALHIAQVLAACDLVPDTIDKLICISYLYGLDDEMKKTPVIPTLYSSSHDTMLPTDIITVNMNKYESLEEGLYAWPGYVKLNVQLADYTSINTYYASILKRRVLAAVNSIVNPIVPKWGTLTAKTYSEEELNILLQSLCAYDVLAPDIFHYDFFNISALPNISELLYRNEVPMEPQYANTMVNVINKDLTVLHDIAKIWHFFLNSYCIQYSSLQDGQQNVEQQAILIDKLARDLGFDAAIHAYFTGVPLAHIFS